jgi:DnaJ-domain-containing protein 1
LQNKTRLMASRSPKFHGRVEGAAAHCAVPGCPEAGEFRAPLSAPTFDGPGAWQWLCLEHVREHNARYNYFLGMSPEEIEAAQSPIAGWERGVRAFAHAAGADPAPAWGDFNDPLEAIRGRFGRRRTGPAAEQSRFTGPEKAALGVLGLGGDADLAAVRKAYSVLVRRYHPDRNGGDRTQEAKLRNVIDAWQTLKVAPAFA